MSEPYAATDGLVRVYPATGPSVAGLVWLHGGGFAYGDLDMPEADTVARELAARGVTVVSVDYRLAPVPEDWRHRRAEARTGHRYPAALDDVARVWRWAQDAAASLGVERFAIGGASAGANIAAGSVLRLLAANDPAVLPRSVVLAYPTLLALQPAPGPRLRAALDARPEADGFGYDSVRAMYENYLGGEVVGAPIDAVPGLASIAELAQFPPTLIVAGDYDELTVSAEVFAANLRAAGRSVELVVEPGTVHGHLNRFELPQAAASIERIAAHLAAH